ncbi:MAG: fatty acid desaturase [Pleurocapsa sp. MO_226.B13]|nr:fatty acid desaturase [Pleurocapsa sp. MO_226.B13]
MITSIKSNKSKMLDRHYYISQHKPIANLAAISYTFSAYICGVILLFESNLILNVVGIFLLTHGLAYSAYLTHEFMHGTIFKNRRCNSIFGNIMLWLNGGCYNGFQALTLQHIAHHVDRVDIFTFEPIPKLQKLPTITRRIILALEWLYFPAMGFWSRWHSVFSPFWNPERSNEKGRVLSILLLRVGIFSLIGAISFKALLLYFIAYIGMITVLRWSDAFQHTYEGFPPGVELPKRDRAHEEAHTYSTLLSRKHPWLNVLLLNFGYHNAHHTLMKCPWHSLPELNQEIEKPSKVRYVSLRQQLVHYHRFRVIRFILGQGEAVDENQNPTFDKFYGAHDVSFLFMY